MSPTLLHTKTPMVYSQYLRNKCGKDVYFKLDALQPSGSFKLRGIGRLCQEYVEQGMKQFISSSGGNAGIAVAYCGMKLGIPTTVVIPETSHQVYIDIIRGYQADVIVKGKVWDEAQEAALQLVKQSEFAAYIPPFDHPTIWSGHASIMDEVVQDGLKPDVVVLAVGGGGLACGVLQGLANQAWHDIPLIAVETLGADSFAQSVKAGHRVRLNQITSRATSLGAKEIAERLVLWLDEHPIHSIVVTDEEAEQGAREFARDQRVLVELAAGAPLSLAYHSHPILDDFQTILMIACGGVNTTFFGIV